MSSCSLACGCGPLQEPVETAQVVIESCKAFSFICFIQENLEAECVPVADDYVGEEWWRVPAHVWALGGDGRTGLM